MLLVRTTGSQRNSPVPSYTVAQTAAITGVPQTAINQYLDRELVFIRTIGAGFRAVRQNALVGLVLNHDLVGSLTLEGRLEVVRQVLADPRKKSVSLQDNPVSVSVVGARSKVAKGLSRFRTAKDMVVEKEDVLGGEPCLKGTRLSVHLLNELFAACGRDEVLETYPDISVAQLDAALMYAQMYPKKGRPRSVGARLEKAKPTRTRSVRVKLPA